MGGVYGLAGFACRHVAAQGLKRSGEIVHSHIGGAAALFVQPGDKGEGGRIFLRDRQ